LHTFAIQQEVQPHGRASQHPRWQSVTSTSVRTVRVGNARPIWPEGTGRTTTKEDSLSKAKEFAEDWYLQLRGKLRDGELKTGKLFRDAAKLYLREFDIMTQGQRSAKYASGQHARANGYLIPFFGSMVLPEITAGKVNEYRVHRLEEFKALRGKPPARSTMHQEIVTLRQIFKTALRHGWVDHLPDFSAPYRASAKISHRAWFSPEEYKQLYEATRRRAQDSKQPRFRWEADSTFTNMFCSQPTPDSAPTRRGVFSSAMSQ
jgi:hypothetical protein